jgi:hypothetical protein
VEAIGIAIRELDLDMTRYISLEGHGLSKKQYPGWFFFGFSPTI